MDFKKDGWNWIKKLNGSATAVREDRAKLVINREMVILGTYVHSMDASNFHRRSYTLRDSVDKTVLVHYLEDQSKHKQSLLRPSLPPHGVHDSLVDFCMDDDHKLMFPEEMDDLLEDVDLTTTDDNNNMNDMNYIDNTRSESRLSPKAMSNITGLSGIRCEEQVSIYIYIYIYIYLYVKKGSS
jgi:hypothetical protein